MGALRARMALVSTGDYREAIARYDRVMSMSVQGNCRDDAVAESTIGTVKTEALGDYVPVDIHELGRTVFPYIEGFYNHLRLHSSLVTRV